MFKKGISIIMKEMRQKTDASLVAQAIRRELKQVYPHVKFNVRSRSYCGGDSVTISYIDELGSLSKQKIDNVVEKYRGGYFDCQTDMYRYKDTCDRHHLTTKYLFVEREIGEALKSEAETYFADYFCNWAELSEWHKQGWLDKYYDGVRLRKKRGS